MKTSREIAWEHLIAEANKDEIVKALGMLYQKWEYLNTIESVYTKGFVPEN